MNSNLCEGIVRILVKPVITNIRLRSFLIVTLSMFNFYSFRSLAQTDSTKVDSVDISVNVDLVSRYIWRGQNYGQAPSIQPYIELGWKNFTLGAWGAYKFTGEGEQETDFYLSKTFGPVTLSVWDYWTFCDTNEIDFFDYNEETTGHLLETQILLADEEVFPFGLMGGWFFYGADSTKSLYLELQYYYSKGTTEVTAFAGYQAKGSFYASDPGFVNVGFMVTKPIPITERWELPLCLGLIANPFERSVYVVAGITF
jgi:hypothetical protein